MNKLDTKASAARDAFRSATGPYHENIPWDDLTHQTRDAWRAVVRSFEDSPLTPAGEHAKNKKVRAITRSVLKGLRIMCAEDERRPKVIKNYLNRRVKRLL